MKIQYGSSYGYPVSSWGSHVSECPNQQTGRTTPLSTRANVAYFGAFGYEMDLNTLDEEEIALVKEQVAFMKANRKLIQYGTFYRLEDPYKGNRGAWMVVSPDKREAIVGVYKLLNGVNTADLPCIRLQGLDEGMDYRINGGAIAHGGDELMSIGLLPLDASTQPMAGVYGAEEQPELAGDFASCLFHLTACD